MEVKKMTIEFADGTQKEIKKGLAMYVTENDKDAEALFFGLTEDNQKALINALMFSLHETRQQIKKWEQEEKA